MLKRLSFAWVALILILAAPFAVRAQELIAPPTKVPQELIAPPTKVVDPGESPLTPFVVNETIEGHGNGRCWFSGDYLFAWVRGANVPALVTTSPVGTPQNVAGIFGVSGTQTLFGNDWLNDRMRSGLRLQAGWWCNDSVFGVEAGLLYIAGQNSSFSGTSDAFPILARPFFDFNTGTPQAVLVAFPGSSTGSIDARVAVNSFYSINLDIAERALEGPGFRLTALAGYRFYRFDDSLTVRQTLVSTNPNFPPGTTASTNDSFSAKNNFHGFDMGFRAQYLWERVSLELLAKLAIGDLHRQITIAGDQTTVVPGTIPVVENAGVLALASNSGTFTSHDWKVMPEVGATLNWQVRPNVNVRVGYSFLLLNGISRASDQVDTTINPNFFPPATGVGAARPAFILNRTDTWIQSINVGLLFTY